MVRAYVEHAHARARAGVEALLLRPDVPPRAAAEGAPAAVLADRRRGDRPRRCRRRRRGAAAAARPAAPTSASRGAEVQINSLGDRELPAGLSRRAASPGAQAHARRAVRGLPAPPRAEPAAPARLQAAGLRRPSATARRACSITSATPCRAHFDARARSCSRREGVRPQLHPYMVRGLDYYCAPRSRWWPQGLGAQNALGGGGRYDGLVQGPRRAGRRRHRLRARRRAPGDRARRATRGAAPRRPEFVIAPLGAAAEARGDARWRTAGGAPACASRSSPAGAA